MSGNYREIESGTLVYAYQVPEGEHDVAYNRFQESQDAVGGEWIVSYARGSETVVDPESFDRDFERVP